MKLRVPHPLTLLLACIVAASVATHLLPAGEFERRADPATGRNVVVAGTYHPVPPSPAGPFQTLVAIPRGMADAGSVIFLIFLAGGAFAVVDATGALRRALDRLVRALQDRETLVIPIACLLFGAGGALENMQEEIIPLVPVLLLLARRLGFDAVVAAAVSVGAAAVGASFSPVNPFQVGIAQKLAELPPLSGSLFRTAFLVAALGLWTWGTARHARRTRTRPQAAEPGPSTDFTWRDATVLLLVLAGFATFVFGVVRLGWGFEEMGAVFFAMGFVAGLMGRLGFEGTALAYVEGFRSMAFAAMLVGFARVIFVVLNEGHVIDTIVNGLFRPIAGLPRTMSALGMLVAHTAIHVPVPSVSGQAVLTLPVLVPLSDLIGLSRQVTVLAYQYGAGLCDLLTPTNGALMAVLAAAGVRYEAWVKLAFPLYLVLIALAVLALVAASVAGLH
ncbi:MAG TPA: YfcC family protein [Gemmatimonadota bacterium]|jgi:uncharacterized ion transporter superfamily protein YfcC